MSKMKMMKRFLTALLVVTLMMAACAPAASASIKARMFITTNVYQVPSTSARSVRVPQGLLVDVTATRYGWAQIMYKGRTAYIQLPYLDLANRLTAYTCKSTPVFRQPSGSSSVMGTLSIGTAVYVVNKIGNFYRVQNSSGSVSGYVLDGYLTNKATITAYYNAYNAYKQQQAMKAAAAAAAKSSGGNSAVNALYAALKSQLGKPYSASATYSANPSSFNCSTFVRYIMEGCFGIPMMGTAAEQAADARYQKITSISSLRAGDIVCFCGDNSTVCDHTGIYVGAKNGKHYFVEASRNARKVQLNELDGYYQSHFLWARRLV